MRTRRLLGPGARAKRPGLRMRNRFPAIKMATVGEAGKENGKTEAQDEDLW